RPATAILTPLTGPLLASKTTWNPAISPRAAEIFTAELLPSQMLFLEDASSMPVSCLIFPLTGSILQISGIAHTFSLSPAAGGLPPLGCQSLMGIFGTVSFGLDFPLAVATGETFPAPSIAAISTINASSGGRYSSTNFCVLPAFSANGIFQRGT